MKSFIETMSPFSASSLKFLSNIKILRYLLVVSIVVQLSLAAGYAKVDDSFIYARYVANALAGHGMVFNIGEHVNAITSPLYAYVLLLTSWFLRGNVLLAAAVLSGLFLCTTCLLAETMIPLAGLFIASTAYFYELVGMESSLFLLMILAALMVYQSNRYTWLPLVCTLLVLTRFEGSLLVALLLLQVYRKRVMPNWRAFIPAGAVLLGYFGLNHHYYGAMLPSSASAKLAQGFSGYWGPWPTSFLGHTEMINIAFQRTWFLLPLIVVFALYAVVSYRREALTQVIAVFSILLLAFYVGLNLSGLYFWYFAPFVFFGVLLAARAIPHTKMALVIVAVVLLVSVRRNVHMLASSRTEARYLGYVEASKWLKSNTPVNARVEVVEIGLVGWYADRYILDVVGLTTPKNATHIANKDCTSWLNEDKPDYILVHRSNWIWEKVAKDSLDYFALPMHFDGDLYLLQRKEPTNAARGY